MTRGHRRPRVQVSTIAALLGGGLLAAELAQARPGGGHSYRSSGPSRSYGGGGGSSGFGGSSNYGGGSSSYSSGGGLDSFGCSMAGACEHCSAHLTRGEFDWVLSKIEQDESYRG